MGFKIDVELPSERSDNEHVDAIPTRFTGNSIYDAFTIKQGTQCINLDMQQMKKIIDTLYEKADLSHLFVDAKE